MKAKASARANAKGRKGRRSHRRRTSFRPSGGCFMAASRLKMDGWMDGCGERRAATRWMDASGLFSPQPLPPPAANNKDASSWLQQE